MTNGFSGRFRGKAPAVRGLCLFIICLAPAGAALAEGIAFYVGLGVLLLAVIRQRMLARKTDRYKDVEI